MTEPHHNEPAIDASDADATDGKLNGNGNGAHSSEQAQDLPQMPAPSPNNKKRGQHRPRVGRVDGVAPVLDQDEQLWRHGRLVVKITLTTRHKEEQVEVACGSCGGRTCGIYAPREYWGKHIIVSADEMAGYKCQVCDVEAGDIDAMVEFLTLAVKAIEPTNDPAAIKDLQKELAIAKAQQKSFHSSAA